MAQVARESSLVNKGSDLSEGRLVFVSKIPKLRERPYSLNYRGALEIMLAAASVTTRGW